MSAFLKVYLFKFHPIIFILHCIMRFWVHTSLFISLFTSLGNISVAPAQVKWMEGRWTILNGEDHIADQRSIRMRKFRESDKYKKHTLAWNFKKDTGYLIEEQFWRVVPPESLDKNYKSFGYNGVIFEWIWESKDEIKVFNGDTFKEYKIRWFGSNRLVFKRVYSKKAKFEKLFQNLSNR